MWMTLEQVARAIGAQTPIAGETPVAGVVTDTRMDCAGCVFVALRGETHDGHAYAERALDQGAAAVVVDHAEPATVAHALVAPDTLLAYQAIARAHRNRFAIPLVGVTGSVGKTSTREMIAAALGARYSVLSSERNHNNDVGVAQTVLRLGAGHTAAVVEMGMRGAGEIARLARAAGPTIGVVTNIGLSHIELLGSRDAIAAAKAELLDALPPDGCAVIPFDDPYRAALASRCPCPVRTFGLGEGADFRAAEVAFGLDGSPSFRVNGVEFAIPSPGVHHVANAAAACAVAAALGIAVDEVAARLREYRPPAMRMTPVRAASGATVLDDSYNAAPDSMRAGLETLALTASGAGQRAVAFVGEMKELGSHSEEAHRYIGRIAADLRLGLVVTVGEGARAAAEEAARGLGDAAVRWYETAAQAASDAPALVGPDDVALVKGSRAMRMEQIVQALTEADPQP